MDERLTHIAELAQRNGELAERNRILGILVQYKEAGWLDNALVSLLVDDICIDD